MNEFQFISIFLLGFVQVWIACGWKTCVDLNTFFAGLRGQLDLPQLVTRSEKEAEIHLCLIKLRWGDIQPLLGAGIDVGDAEYDGKTHSDGIFRVNRTKKIVRSK